MHHHQLSQLNQDLSMYYSHHNLLLCNIHLDFQDIQQQLSHHKMLDNSHLNPIHIQHCYYYHHSSHHLTKKYYLGNLQKEFQDILLLNQHMNHQGMLLAHYLHKLYHQLMHPKSNSQQGKYFHHHMDQSQ